jgi:predicted nucleic acid-binding protein
VISAIVLDSGPLGKVANPLPHPDAAKWLANALAARIPVYIPEISDFEVRRNLLLHRRSRSVDRLDDLHRILIYRPITTGIMRQAAEFWADARRIGKPTADPKELDSDVILAAQALEVSAIVATENVGHLSRYVNAVHWRAIKF